MKLAATAFAAVLTPVCANAAGGYDMRAMMAQPYTLNVTPPAMLFSVPGRPAPVRPQPAPAARATVSPGNPYVPATAWPGNNAPRVRNGVRRGASASPSQPAPASVFEPRSKTVATADSDVAGTGYFGWGDSGTWRLALLNEDRGPLDGVWGKSDSGHLTWGWRISYTPDAGNPPWLGDLRQMLGWPGNQWQSRVTYAIEQAAYTKHSINANEGYLDRPYAGVLLASARVNLSKPFDGPFQQNDFLELGLGVVGDASGAEAVHEAVHDGSGRSSRDWEGKLDSEPVLLIGYEKGLRTVFGPDRWLQVELYPYIGAQIGNMFSTGSVGTSVRIGRELKRDAGAPRIRYLSEAETYPEHGAYWMWSIFASAEQKAVGWNIFTDGNTYRDTSDVTTKPFPREFSVGAEVGYGAIRATLAHVYRTEEFEEQDGEDRFVRFGVSAHF